MSEVNSPELFVGKQEILNLDIEELEVEGNDSESATSADKNRSSFRSKRKSKYCPAKKGLQYSKRWEQIFVWVQQRNRKAFCMVCGKSLSNHTGHLKRHESRKSHQNNLQSKQSQIDFLKTKWNRFKESHQEELKTHYNDTKVLPTIVNENLSDSDNMDLEIVTVPMKHGLLTPLESDVQSESPRPRRGRVNKKFDPNMKQYIEVETEKPTMIRVENFKYDDNFNFLMSFLPHMKNMPLEKNFHFRAEMSRLLLEIFARNSSKNASTSTSVSFRNCASST